MLVPKIVLFYFIFFQNKEMILVPKIVLFLFYYFLNKEIIFVAKIVLFYFVKERNDRIRDFIFLRCVLFKVRNIIFLRYVLFKVRIIIFLIFLRYVLFKMRIIRVSIIYIHCVEDEPESASTTLLSQASFRRRRKGYSFLGALESCLIPGAISCLPDATERAAAASLPPCDRGLPRLTSDPVT